MMEIGTKKAWRDLAAFLLIFGVLVAIGSLALSNLILWVWFGALLLLSALQLWKVWRVRHDPERAKLMMDLRWGAVLPRKVFFWMGGNDEDSNPTFPERHMTESNDIARYRERLARASKKLRTYRADIRGSGAAMFLHVTGGTRAIELSEDSGLIYLELWDSKHDGPVATRKLQTYKSALADAVNWLKLGHE